MREQQDDTIIFIGKIYGKKEKVISRRDFLLRKYFHPVIQITNIAKFVSVKKNFSAVSPDIKNKLKVHFVTLNEILAVIYLFSVNRNTGWKCKYRKRPIKRTGWGHLSKK